MINFSFITDYSSLSTLDVAVMVFNLALLYFMWDVAKFIINVVSAKLGKGRNKWN